MKVLKLILLLCAFPSVSVNAQDAQTFYNAAFDFIMNDNYNDGYKYMKKAADLGYVPAVARLGLCYEEGWGVSKDMNKAAKLYQKAADNGDIDAIYWLSLCYAMDDGGVPTDFKMSFDLCKKAAKKGHQNAMADLAIKYYMGEGCTKDEQLANKWAKEAEKKGDRRGVDYIELWDETGSNIRDIVNDYLDTH